MSASATIAAIESGLANQGLSALVEQSGLTAQCAAWVELVLDHNTRTNLVGVKDVDRAADELVADSLQVVPLLRRLPKMPTWGVDIGSGAGVPGMVLAIALPEIRWTLSEPRRKRAEFLEAARVALGLKNVDVVQKRVETMPRQPWDLAVSRATFPPDRWFECALDLVGFQSGAIAVWTNDGAFQPPAALAPGAHAASVDYALASGRTRTVSLVSPQSF